MQAEQTRMKETSGHFVVSRTRAELNFARFVVISALLLSLGMYSNVWNIGPNGLSEFSEGTPYWDFSNLWSGSRMALQGQIGFLFDVDQYRATLRAMFHPDMLNQEWSYPPSILLIGVPISLLPIFWSYVVWTFGTIICLHFAVKSANLPLFAHLAVLAAPSVIVSATFGQNGSLTGALLIGGLMAMRARPVLAGVLFGILTIKPQLGILLPVCIIASFNIRCLISAGLTTIAIALLTGVFFGFDVWPHFFTDTRAIMTEVLQFSFPYPYQINQFTYFVLCRSLGLGLTASYIVQGIATLACIIAVFYLWWPANRVDHLSKVSLTAMMSIMATPYGYSYDTVPFSFALAVWYLRAPSPNNMVFAIMWLVPLMTPWINTYIGCICVLFPSALAIYGMKRVMEDRMALQPL